MKKFKKVCSLAITIVFLLNSVPYSVYAMGRLHTGYGTGKSWINLKVLELAIENNQIKLSDAEEKFAILMFKNFLLTKHNEEESLKSFGISKLDKGISIFNTYELAVLSTELAKIKNNFTSENIEKILEKKGFIASNKKKALANQIHSIPGFVQAEMTEKKKKKKVYTGEDIKALLFKKAVINDKFLKILDGKVIGFELDLNIDSPFDTRYIQAVLAITELRRRLNSLGVKPKAIVIITHRGRPDVIENPDDINKDKFRVEEIAKWLSSEEQTLFGEDNIGESVIVIPETTPEALAQALKRSNGEILFLQNTRLNPLLTKKKDDPNELKKFAEQFDVLIDDAYGRGGEGDLRGMSRFVPTVLGNIAYTELELMIRVMNNKEPVLTILAGIKPEKLEQILPLVERHKPGSTIYCLGPTGYTMQIVVEEFILGKKPQLGKSKLVVSQNVLDILRETYQNTPFLKDTPIIEEAVKQDIEKKILAGISDKDKLKKRKKKLIQEFKIIESASQGWFLAQKKGVNIKWAVDHLVTADDNIKEGKVYEHSKRTLQREERALFFGEDTAEDIIESIIRYNDIYVFGVPGVSENKQIERHKLNNRLLSILQRENKSGRKKVYLFGGDTDIWSRGRSSLICSTGGGSSLETWVGKKPAILAFTWDKTDIEQYAAVSEIVKGLEEYVRKSRNEEQKNQTFTAEKIALKIGSDLNLDKNQLLLLQAAILAGDLSKLYPDESKITRFEELNKIVDVVDENLGIKKIKANKIAAEANKQLYNKGEYNIDKLLEAYCNLWVGQVNSKIYQIKQLSSLERDRLGFSGPLPEKVSLVKDRVVVEEIATHEFVSINRAEKLYPELPPAIKSLIGSHHNAALINPLSDIYKADSKKYNLSALITVIRTALAFAKAKTSDTGGSKETPEQILIGHIIANLFVPEKLDKSTVISIASMYGLEEKAKEAIVEIKGGTVSMENVNKWWIEPALNGKKEAAESLVNEIIKRAKISELAVKEVLEVLIHASFENSVKTKIAIEIVDRARNKAFEYKLGEEVKKIKKVVADIIAKKEVDIEELKEADMQVAESGVDILKWINQKVILDRDMFRDYDYRTKGKEISPAMTFRLALVWAKMSLDRARELDIQNRKVIVARDCRDTNPEIVNALIAGLRYVGLDVVYIADDVPNCASSYAWAVMQHNPLMSIFITASHVTGKGVSGFKVAIQGKDGELESLTTKQIKRDSLKHIQRLIANPEEISRMKVELGSYSVDNIDGNFVRMAALVARVASQRLNIHKLATEFRQRRNQPLAVLSEWENKVGQSKILKGLKVVIEGSHTPSGPIAKEVFERLGAEVILLHPEVKLLSGDHKADPSKNVNLEDVKWKTKETKADFGLAFDLDGDRVAVIFSKISEDMESLPSDNLIAMLLPFLKKCGYDPQRVIKHGKKGVAVVRDVLGTEAADKTADLLGIETFQTDAGYVFLKAKVKELKEAGFVVPVYGESSGHSWLEVSGVFENPIVLSSLVGIMIKEYKDKYPNSEHAFEEVVKENIAVPYRRSGRFDPKFHPNLFRIISDNMSPEQRAEVDNWTYKSEGKIPQQVIAFGRDYVIRKMCIDFAEGTTFTTTLGALTVESLDAYEEDGMYRYADIRFNLDGEYVGRFVFRASANDSNFVCSWEVEEKVDETTWRNKSQKIYDLIGAVVMNWLDKNEFSPISDGSVCFKNKENVIGSLEEGREMLKDTADLVGSFAAETDLQRISGLPIKLGVDDKLIFEKWMKPVVPAVRMLKADGVNDKEGLEKVIKDPNIITEENKNTILYDMYRAIYEDENLRYDITVIPPAMLGTEYVKTTGHFHPGLYPEVYEILNGEAYYLLQKKDGSDFIMVHARKGDKVIMPPDYGHITVNVSKETLVMANWVSNKFKSEYGEIKEKRGAMYYLEDKNGELRIVRNPNYEDIPGIRVMKPANLIAEFGLEKNKSMYSLITRAPEKLDYLNNPQKYKDVFAKALVELNFADVEPFAGISLEGLRRKIKIEQIIKQEGQVAVSYRVFFDKNGNFSVPGVEKVFDNFNKVFELFVKKKKPVIITFPDSCPDDAGKAYKKLFKMKNNKGYTFIDFSVESEVKKAIEDGANIAAIDVEDKVKVEKHWYDEAKCKTILAEPEHGEIIFLWPAVIYTLQSLGTEISDEWIDEFERWLINSYKGKIDRNEIKNAFDVFRKKATHPGIKMIVPAVKPEPKFFEDWQMILRTETWEGV